MAKLLEMEMVPVSINICGTKLLCNHTFIIVQFNIISSNLKSQISLSQ